VPDQEVEHLPLGVLGPRALDFDCSFQGRPYLGGIGAG
jgi:hypothetical protein